MFSRIAVEFSKYAREPRFPGLSEQYFEFHSLSFESFPVPVNTGFQDYRNSISKFARAFLIQRRAKQPARHMPARAIQSRRPADARQTFSNRQVSNPDAMSCPAGASWARHGSNLPPRDMAAIGRLGVRALASRGCLHILVYYYVSIQLIHE